MGSVAVLLVAVALGWLVARMLTAGAWNGGVSAILLQVSLGTLFGPAILSLAGFALVAFGMGNRIMLWAALAALMATAATGVFRLGKATPSLPAPARGWRWNWALLIAASFGLATFLAGFYATSAASPAGYWDAFAIWNVRARFLAGGMDTWRRAFSPDLSASHPGYPLLLSASIAAEWIAGGGVTPSVSMTTSLVFALAVLAALGSSIAARRGWALGLLAALVLLATDTFAAQAPAQYADLPLALCFLAALVLLESAAANNSAPLFAAAGVASGLAPWTKNEGWPFLLAVVGLVAWRWGRRPALWTILGCVPGAAATLVMKVFLVSSSENMFPKSAAEVFTKIADPTRWWRIAAGFAGAAGRLGAPWAHPVILVAALILVLGVVARSERAALAWLLAPLGAVFAADYAVFLVTTNDLEWHLGTSIDRLLLQLWPPLLFVVFLSLQPVEDVNPHTGALPARGSRTEPRKKSSPPRAPSVGRR
jgi:hypothetical protein